jgi:hypothetical protein
LQKKIVLCGPRFAFQHDTFQALESLGERGRRYGIHISDGNILPGHAVHSPPLPTHKRHRRTILRILDKLKDTRQVFVRQYRHDVLLFRLHFLPVFHILFLLTSSTLSFNAKKEEGSHPKDNTTTILLLLTMLLPLASSPCCSRSTSLFKFSFPTQKVQETAVPFLLQRSSSARFEPLVLHKSRENTRTLQKRCRKQQKQFREETNPRVNKVLETEKLF